jgi:hypothetical protein
MRLILGPVACQGCGDPVRYIEPAEGLPAWFQFDLNLFSAVPPVILRRHRCPAGPRPIPAQILRPWSVDGEPIVFEDRLYLGEKFPRPAEATA